MKTQWTIALFVALVALPMLRVQAREWTDKSGKYQVNAELVAYSEEKAILQRDDHRLVSVAIAELSEADQKFLKSKEAKDIADAVTGKQQVWTTRSGLKVPGKVVDFIRKDVTVQRRRGKVYVNDRVFDNLPQIYQKIVPQVVAYFEKNKIDDKKTLEAWLAHKKGKPFTYTCDGVVFELASGDEYAVPFFMFSEKDQEFLMPGWEEWVGAKGDFVAQGDSAFRLQSRAAAKQQDDQTSGQVAQMQLLLQAVDAGVTSLWEVTLYPVNNSVGPPLCVVVPGRDSRAATATALQRNPGYRAGPVRRVSD